MYFTVAINRLYRLNAFPGFATVRSGIHRQSATNRARDTGKKFGRAELPTNALAGQLSAWHAGARTHEIVVGTFKVAQYPRGRNHHARQTTIANQEITANAVPENRDVCVEFTEKRTEVFDAGGHKEYLGRTTRAPGRMAAHRLVDSKLALHRKVACGSHHLCTFKSGPLRIRSGSPAA